MAHVGFRGVGLDHRTSAAMRAPSRALLHRRALCTADSDVAHIGFRGVGLQGRDWRFWRASDVMKAAG